MNQMNHWISIEDRLPVIDGQYPRVLVNNRKRIEIALYRGNNVWFVGKKVSDMGTLKNPEPEIFDDYVSDVTHWMPLPNMEINFIDPSDKIFTQNDIVQYSLSAYKRGSISTINQVKKQILLTCDKLTENLKRDLKG